MNAQGMIVGKLASYVAKQALLGHTLRVFNCEGLFITGNKKQVVAHYYHRFYGRGKALKGPYYSRLPDRFFRRIVRGMLPQGESEKSRGRIAFSRVSCFLGIPEKFKNVSLLTVDACAINKTRAVAVTPITELMKALGGKS